MANPAFLDHPSDMAQRIASYDWSATVGPTDNWPQSLKTITAFLLHAPLPIVLLWGEDGVMIYNDAYSEFAGQRHPELLGSKVREGWPEVAEFNDNVMRVGLGGDTLAYKDQELTLHRSGHPESVWMNLDYSPVLGEDGRPAGVIAIVVETTERVRAEQRLLFLDSLGQEIAGSANAATILAITTRMVGEHLGLSVCAYADMDEDQDGFTIRGDWAAPGANSIVGHYSLADFGTLAVERLGARQPLIINDNAVELPAHEAATFQNIGIAATICMPLVKAGRLTALMAIHDRVPRRWSEYDLSLIREVTERAWAHVERVGVEAELRASEQSFETLALAMPTHVWTASPDGQLDWFNEQVYAYTGAEPGSLHGDRWASVVHPDDLPTAAERWTTALMSHEAYETSFRLCRADGVWRWHIARAVAIKGPSGEIVRWIGANTDFQDQREVAEALADLNETLERQVVERTAELRRFRDIVEATTSPICAFDPDYSLIAFNKAHNDEFRRVNGVDSKLGDIFPDLFIPEQRIVMRRLMARALSGESFTVTEKFGRPELGQPLWEIHYTPLRDESGYIVGAFHLANDISDRVRAEAELTAAQDALRQAQKMEAVGQLTGGLAHDFNNLLTGMMGNLELLNLRIARGQYDDIERFITSAQGAGRRAASLTQRLLAFSRRQTLDPKPTDINRLVIGMEDLLRRTVGPSTAIEIVGSAGLWIASIDAGQLENALLNLCINGRDAMPDGGRLTIETANKWLDARTARQHDLEPGQYVSLCVTDTGHGMTPDTIERAFEPFFTTKPIGQGTGLGLSMIYGFARQSGGQVRIYSEVGQGTTVCIYLPRHHGEAQDPTIDQASHNPDSGKGRTVLVVDDEPTVRHLIDEVLDEHGYAVIGAADGAAGLKVLQSGARIDLLITDVGLPNGMNGRQVADAARVMRPGLKVLFITGYAENAAVGNGHLDAGMELLTKPFRMEELASRVAEMMKP